MHRRVLDVTNRSIRNEGQGAAIAHDVGLHLVRDSLVPARHERMRDLFGIALIHLATVGLDEKFRHERAKIIHARAAFATSDDSVAY
jgi:hypothetical protein